MAQACGLQKCAMDMSPSGEYTGWTKDERVVRKASQGEPTKPDIPSVYDETEDFDTELEEDLIIEEEW
jgi:hypothetical protein